MTDLKARLATCKDKPMIIDITEVIYKPKNYHFALLTTEIQLPGYEPFTRNLDHNVMSGVLRPWHSMQVFIPSHDSSF